jgi:hypothetical protein
MTNEHLYQFGMATLLGHIPVLHLLTYVLDASNPSVLDAIAKFIALFLNFMKTKAVKLLSFNEQRVAEDSESNDFRLTKANTT